MAAELTTRRQLEQALIMKCWKEPDFRKEILSDPKGMLESHLGKKLPNEVKIFIHEENPETLHLYIPAPPSNVSELSDEDLEKVAGGTDFAITVITSVLAIATVASVATGIGGAVGYSQGW